jgi:hypothetical protein
MLEWLAREGDEGGAEIAFDIRIDEWLLGQPEAEPGGPDEQDDNGDQIYDREDDAGDAKRQRDGGTLGGGRNL